jgi:riboflavin synthase
MFTGLVEETAPLVEVADVDAGRRIMVVSGQDHQHTQVGDSIAIDGVCLTVVMKVAMPAPLKATGLTFHVGPETLRVTTFGALLQGERVHLERALRVGDRLGGHLVSGHVDGLGHVHERREESESLYLTLAVPDELVRYCITKGSITVMGVSLTINALRGGLVELCLIPHTLLWTKLGELAVGTAVNIEVDHMGKWVERLLQPHHKQLKTD